MKDKKIHPVMAMKSFQKLKEELKWTIIDKSIRPVVNEHIDPLLIKMKKLKDRLVRKYRNQSQLVLVSIIMPTYNRAKVIPLAIQSVLNQTYRNWELIIIDDGGEDDTERVVRAIKDPRILYFKKRFNKGAGRARNTGLRLSSGQYVAYLDSDNEWDPEYLLLMINVLQEDPQYKSIYCGQDIYRHANSLMPSRLKGVRAGLFNRSLLENRNYIDLNVYMHHRSLYEQLGGFDERLERLLDWDLILRYSDDRFPFFLPCRLGSYYYGRAENQITLIKSPQSIALIRAKWMSDRFRETVPELQKKKKTSSFFSTRTTTISQPALNRRTTVIFIQNSNRPKLSKLCLAALMKCTDSRSYSLIIVEHSHKIQSAILMAEPEHDIAILDSATLVTNDWLNGLQSVLLDMPDAGIVVPRRVLPRRSATIKHHVPHCSPSFEADVSLSLLYRNITDPFIMPSKGYVELSKIPLGGALISRMWLKIFRITSLLENLDFGSDDQVCEKVVHDGFKIIYTPHSKFYDMSPFMLT